MPPRHLVGEPARDLIEAAIRGSAVQAEPMDGLLAATFARGSTRTRVSACRAAKTLGLDFVEIPWGSFYGNPSVHPFAPNNTRAELRSLQELGARAFLIRIDGQQTLEHLAEISPIPVISGGTTDWHPLQALADIAVLADNFPDGAPRIAIVGNGSGPVASALIAGAPALGCEVVVVAPPGFGPRPELVSRGAVRVEPDLEGGIEHTDVVYVDEWFYRTPTDAESEVFRRYVVTEDVIRRVAPEAKIMHCLPHAGEIEEPLLFGRRSLIWEQVRARTETLATVLQVLIR